MADKIKIKKGKALRRKIKVRSKIRQESGLPRLSVLKSNRHLYAQLIDDDRNITLVSASDFEIKKGSRKEKPEKSAR